MAVGVAVGAAGASADELASPDKAAAQATEERQHCPEAFVVRVVDGVGIADESDSGPGVLPPPTPLHDEETSGAHGTRLRCPNT